MLLSHLDTRQVYTDPLIEKGVYNLCDSAHIYGRTLTCIRTGFRIENETCIWFIEDGRIGIAPNLKEVIVQKGYGQTSGLGLYFVREILAITNIMIREKGSEDHGGQI